MSEKRSVWKGFSLVAGSGAVLWVVFAVWIAPYLLARAYHGQSWSALNRLIRGQETHPVGYYLDLWRTLALRATAGLALLGVLAALVIWQRAKIRQWLGDLWGRLPALRDRDVLLAALFLGCLNGFVEALHAGVSYWIFHRPSSAWVAGEIYWMVPLAACVTLVVLALAAIGIRHLASMSQRVNGLVVFGFASLCFYSIGQAIVPGILPFALALLSLGLAAQVARFATSRARSYHRLVRVGALVGPLAFGTWALSQPLRTTGRMRDATSPTLATRADARPNVLLLVWDTVRARSLSLYGYHRQTTPSLDSLARSAVVFDAAVSTAPWTLPAHASLFTGRYHHEHSADRNSPLDGKWLTLAEALGQRGYQTGGFVANRFWVGRGFGLDRGFQDFEDRPQVSPDAIVVSWWVSRQIRETLMALTGNRRPALRIPANAVRKSFVSWLDRRDTRPFFAFMNLFDAHEPYLPPRGVGFRFSNGTPLYWWDFLVAKPHTAGELQQLRDAYDSCIHYLDTELGLTLQALRERGLLDNTLIVLTSDHGETLGEHESDLIGHENNVYYDVLNVPLVFYFPSRLGVGRRVADPVSLADVPATILDLVDPGTQNPFPGSPLLAPADAGSQSTAVSRRPAVSQGNPPPYLKTVERWPMSQGPLFSLVEGGTHAIVNAKGAFQLFDLTSDPAEKRDLGATPTGERARERFRATLAQLGVTPF